MLSLAVVLFLLALIFLWQSNRKQHAAGFPGGRIIYTDTQAWQPLEKPLYEPTLNLTGKPDYLVELSSHIIPVEVKSSRVTDAPYDSHIFQLIAYCVLVDRTLGKRPPYGILNYPDRNFAVDFTVAIENTFLDILNEIRIKSQKKNIPRSHQSPARCSSCGYQRICDQSLA
jgi:CRISPR-associated exonuclease Cas4